MHSSEQSRYGVRWRCQRQSCPPSLGSGWNNTSSSKSKGITLIALALSRWEKVSRGQYKSEAWFEESRIRLTAYNVGSVCNWKLNTSCAVLVQNIHYFFSKCAFMKYGKDDEMIPSINPSEITPCGILIDSDNQSSQTKCKYRVQQHILTWLQMKL